MIITIGIFVFYNRYSQPVTDISPLSFVSNSEEQLKEVEKINKKIEETELTKKIINGLIENGFSPDKRILYTIYSPENKVLTISLSNFDGDDKTINLITNIINTISKENNLDTFSVEFSEAKK
ncbi:hypothetical protein [Lysinibacillus xylanilyticus]|uniref:Uncharacterized protein n=1 Tax=Lysinibacillus xylanilyticus TaxID=582475 RepID=A0ABT4EU50_9BACI|nr:hypothetical protein [Lysinibacillus xylanilyticus]MCY9549053.1 hypothetical protein [Lysinibacillus xylanilyticus]MED3804748.1 hypothetical protein [Lysinibacillus xylanilyticus]